MALGLGAASAKRVSRVNGVLVVRLGMKRYRGDSLLRYLAAYTAFLLRAYGVLGQRRAQGRLDVLQTSNLPNFAGLLGAILRRRSIHCVHDVHDPEPELFLSKYGSRPFARLGSWVLALVERRVAAGVDLLLWAVDPDAAVRRRLGQDAVKLRYVPNLPDANIFPQRAPVLKGTRRIVFHGTVARRFGLDQAVRAVGYLVRQGKPCRLDIIGDGDAIPELDVLITDLGLTDCVTLTRRMLPVSEIPAAIGDAAAGVVPLRRDPFIDSCVPTKLLEYVRLGIPVVATATPAIQRLFPSGTLLLVKDGDMEELAQALDRALCEDPTILEMARQAQLAPAAHSWQDWEPAYLHILESLE
jgi:glycosyltransferase involved in cell wall biosynthesis